MRHRANPTSRARARAALEIPQQAGPAVGYVAHITITHQVDSIEALAELVASDLGHGHEIRARARDGRRERPLTHHELGTLLELLARP